MKNMANKIINVLIVDDEQIVREGLRYIIDWNALGFCICGESRQRRRCPGNDPPVPPGTGSSRHPDVRNAWHGTDGKSAQ